MELFKYEFRRSLKKPVTILVIALIFFLGISMFSEMKYFNDKIKHNIEINYSYYIVGTGKDTNEYLIQAYLDEGLINEAKLLEGMATYAEIAMDKYNNGNFQEAYKNEIIVNMLSERWICDSEEKDEILRDNISEIWNELLPEMNYDSFTISQNLDGVPPVSILEVKKGIIDIKYKYDLYSKNIRYVHNYSLNNVTFTYNMVDKYLPLILALFIALTTFNCISDEYRTGVVKNIGTQGMRRSRYYITMIFANFLSAVIVIVSTMVVLNLIVGFLAGFQSLDTPILSHENQWNSITTKAMDLEKSYLKYGTRVYLGPTEVNYDDLALNLFEDYKSITFKIFLIEATGVYLLFGFFLTALTVFISSIFSDKIKALIVLVIILGIGYLTAYMSPSIFNVFSTLRATQIITGSLNLTLLGTFIVLGISILITVLVGITYFKRKDIPIRRCVMGKGVKFQLMRSVKSGKNRWLFIGFLIYIIVFCVFLGYKENSYDKGQQNILNNELHVYGTKLKLISGALKDMDDSNEGYEELKIENDFYQSQYNSLMLMKTLIDNRIKGSKESTEDSLNFIKAKEMKYEGIKKGYSDGVIDDDYLESEDLSIEEVDREVTYINHLVDKKLPLAINPYTLSGESFLRNFFTGANMIIVLAFILLFVIDSYVIELRDDCYKTIYTSPLKRNKLLLSKIIASYILVALIVVLGVLIGFVGVSLIFGGGYLSSPVQMNEGVNGVKLMVENINQTYMPLSSVIIVNFISFLVFALFIVIFSISLSVYTSNDILSLGGMISLIMITYIIHSVGDFMNINRTVNPFAYIFFEDLGKFGLKITNFYGMVMQIILSGLILGLTALKFKKQDLFGVKGD